MKPLRIGTRGSALARWQANHVRDRVKQELSLDTEIILIKTAGDKFTQASVSQMGLKGVFIKELEDALLDGHVDLAVHSMKDVPTEIPRGLEFPAITKRDDPRDCLVSRDGQKLAELPACARVGTSSLRRQAQLRHLRSQLDLRDLRGNVDTRLAKLEDGMYDAVVLAKAGLERLGLAGRITEVLGYDVMLPAVGQGALGIEARAEDEKLLQALAALDDAETRAAVTAERALLAEMQGGCQIPLGACGRIENGELVLDACVLSVDGGDYLRQRAAGSPQSAERLGRELGRKMIAAGADRILRLAGRETGRN